MTVDGLRERLKQFVATSRTTQTPCAHCKGKGYIERSGPLSAVEVERQTGVRNQAVNGFLKGKTINLENGLALIAWLDKSESKTSAFDELDDEDSPPASRESDRLRQIREASAAGRTALAVGAIDAMNRPLNAGGGASLMLCSAGLVS